MYDISKKVTRNKFMQRCGFWYDWLEDTSKALAYIDAPDGGATSFFLELGIPAKSLFPFNWCDQAAREIHCKTGVRCVAEDLCDAVRDHRVFRRHVPTPCAAIWLDLMCTRIDSEVLLGALRLAPKVGLNLSKHTLTFDDQRSTIHDHMTELDIPKSAIIDEDMYKGVGGMKNMTFFMFHFDKYVLQDDPANRAPQGPLVPQLLTTEHGLRRRVAREDLCVTPVRISVVHTRTRSALVPRASRLSSTPIQKRPRAPKRKPTTIKRSARTRSALVTRSVGKGL